MGRRFMVSKNENRSKNEFQKPFKSKNNWGKNGFFLKIKKRGLFEKKKIDFSKKN